jgi:hypothetical protein
MQVGEHHQYLYKQSGQTFTVDAEIIDINGNEIKIKFLNPKGVPYIRSLRSAQERARLVDYHIARPGAPNGNQNAAKDGMHRIAFSLSYANERLAKASQRLQSQGKEANGDTLRSLSYEAIDAYLNTSPEK